MSTQNTTSGYFFTTSAISLMGFMMPTEVSLWVTVIRSYLPVARAASTSWGSVAWPSSARNLSAGTPLETAILYHLSPKAPMENTAARFAVQQRMALSIRPEPDVVERTITLFVWKTFCSLVQTSLPSSVAALPRWEIMGVDILANTSGRTSTGPGIKSFLCIFIPPA